MKYNWNMNLCKKKKYINKKNNNLGADIIEHLGF